LGILMIGRPVWCSVDWGGNTRVGQPPHGQGTLLTQLFLIGAEAQGLVFCHLYV
jgi:hypothetical protein